MLAPIFIVTVKTNDPLHGLSLDDMENENISSNELKK